MANDPTRRDFLSASALGLLASSDAAAAQPDRPMLPASEFRQAAAGAVARSVAAKLADILSARDFGARGDGTTDDGPALQRFLDAIPANGIGVLPPGVYVTGLALTFPNGNVTLDMQGATIKAKAGAQFEYLLAASNKSGIVVRNGTLDANQVERASGQTIRFCGGCFIDCTECTFDNIVAKNTLGHSGMSAVALGIGGVSVRCRIQNCMLIDCGLLQSPSDGVFTSGNQNLVSNCIAKNCTDTGFVIESSNHCGITGCIAFDCSAAAGITNATNTDNYGNYIDGLTVHGWIAPVTGAICIGHPLSRTTGILYDTALSNILLLPRPGGKGQGPAIFIRDTGRPRTTRVRLDNIMIRTSTAQGILIDGHDVAVRNADIAGTDSSAVQFQAGSTGGLVAGSRIAGGTFGVAASGAGAVMVRDCAIAGQVNYNLYAFDTATIISLMNVLGAAGVNHIGKAAGANIIHTGLGTDGSLLCHNSGGIGYGAGAGGVVAQGGSKATRVGLDRLCGTITTHGGTLAAGTGVSFTLANTTIASSDIVTVAIRSGATAASYVAMVDAVANGSCRISLRNISDRPLAEAIVLSFAVIKAAVA